MIHHRMMDDYSEDLRHKIVQALQQQRMNQSETARAFGVSLSSVKRYAKAVSEGRLLSPGKAPGKRPKLDEKARRFLEADVEERPFA
jgi:transposase